MKKVLLGLAMLVSGAQGALADGFECVSEESGLNVKVYNHVDAGNGTRRAAILILSDSSRPAGERTILKASGDALSQSTSNGRIRFSVDPQLVVFTSNPVLGESDVDLSLAQSIKLVTDSPYAVGAEDRTLGMLTISHDDSATFVDMVCTRYLKN